MIEHRLGTLNKSIVIITSLLVLNACVGPYRTINPQDFNLPYHQYAIQDREMEIACQVDILKSTRNKKYVRMERKNNVHLLVVKFKNLGADNVILPDDCIFMLIDSTELIPLTLEETMDAFIGFFPGEVEAKEAANNTFLKIGVVFSNEARQLKSHIDFALEMHAYYIESHVLEPGKELSGLLAIPLFKTETFYIQLADKQH